MHTPASFDESIQLSEALTAEIDQWLNKYPANQRQSAIIPALLTAQRHHGGWLPEAVINAVADYLRIPRMAAYEVATFYSMLELKPVGQYKISVCTNVSCLLNGCERLVQRLQKKLNIKFGQTTQDGQFTLREAECLGACIRAPVVVVNGQYHEQVSEKMIDDILENPESFQKS